mmetsp:Transcript_10163/g.12329  ORF Transcript_10163/g.12329 Transcript_10163/m.12329 type:complete len:152 (-) Transcript_10163:111-566(-)
MAANNRRLTKELDSLEKDPVDGVMVGPVDDDIYHWQAMLEGPAGTPYEGGLFEVDVAFPSEYPFKAPKVKFNTQIYHPNIKKDTGEICADVIVNNWAPTLNVRYVLSTVKQLLEDPNPDSPLEAEIAELFSNDKEKYIANAKAHTAEFASV